MCLNLIRFTSDFWGESWLNCARLHLWLEFLIGYTGWYCILKHLLLASECITESSFAVGLVPMVSVVKYQSIYSKLQDTSMNKIFSQWYELIILIISSKCFHWFNSSLSLSLSLSLPYYHQNWLWTYVNYTSFTGNYLNCGTNFPQLCVSDSDGKRIRLVPRLY